MIALGTDSGPILAPFWDPKSDQIGPKRVPKSIKKVIEKLVEFGIDLVGFWVPKWNQNWSRIGTKSDHEANANIFKIIGRGSVFEDPRCLESIKNRS